jgi:adenine C2-methylase RlmN of 23S rRNA A2503 and tRNA A37
VLRLDDGLEIERVRIPMSPGDSTLCISSQVGCKVGCTFCGAVNLISHDPGSRPVVRAPTEAEPARFIEWLEAGGAMVRRGKTKGRAAMAAGGPLGNPASRRTLSA